MTLFCRFLGLLTCLALLLRTASAHDSGSMIAAVPLGDPEAQCARAAAAAESAFQIPIRLLDAISRIESGRRDPESGALRAWPWTIDANGHGYFYETKEEAIAAARDFLNRGVTSLDVGCMQINLRNHPDAFASLDVAFDPMANARYAAEFLGTLFRKMHGWPAAAGAYHSQTPGIGDDYARRVMALWTGGALPAFSHIMPLSAGFRLAEQTPVGSPFTPHPPTAIAYGPPPRIIRRVTAPGSAFGGMAASSGRTLAAYRAMPVRMAWQGR